MCSELKLATSVYETILLILEKEYLIERIGLCFGLVSTERKVIIEEFSEIDNIEASSSSFSLDYTVMIEKVNYYQKIGKRFVGLFHSHPSGHSLLPSKKDRYFMQYWPFPFIWLIGVFPQLLAFGFSYNQVFQIPYRLFNINTIEY